MGVNIRDLITVAKEVELESLCRRSIAIDAMNALYQFLAIIRQRDGTPLIDGRGNITSHLSGLFYRTVNLVEVGIKPVYVFDGPPVPLKQKTIEERERLREEAYRKWKLALQRGDLKEARKYAQAALHLTPEMIDEAKKLLTYMGIPYVDAKHDGEAQAAYMAAKGDVWATASQDYDSLLFGSPRLVRNLTISGRRKLPGRDEYIKIMPEIIELDKVLSSLGIDRRKLIMIGLLVGTDFNEGVKGIGPKTALGIVKKVDNIDDLFKYTRFKESPEIIKEVFKLFESPDVNKEYKLEWKRPNREKIIEFLCDEHDFSRERVEKAISRLEKAYDKFFAVKGLDAWLFG